MTNDTTEIQRIALAGVAQWIEQQPVTEISIPSQGTCLGCGPGPQLACERQPIDVSLHLFFPSCLSKEMKF